MKGIENRKKIKNIALKKGRGRYDIKGKKTKGE
jgi:hypothetical protein